MTDLCILFGRPERAVDGEDRFELEALAAAELDLESFAIPLDAILDGNAEAALRFLPRPRERTWLYRGWMLSEEEYAELHEAVSARGEELVVDVESFADATYAPNYLPLLGKHTAPARWTESESIEEAWELAQELGPPPWVVKDHVKSVKEAWHRACFVPEGSSYEDFASVCENLLELRGDRFARGFVVKKFLELATLPGWTPEQRRVTDEHRLVFWNGKIAAHAPYYDVDATLPNVEQFAFLGRRIASPFFTADVARLADGGYTVIEINDGGCSTLPEQMDPRDLYRILCDG
jgi:hypothetical protein